MKTLQVRSFAERGPKYASFFLLRLQYTPSFAVHGIDLGDGKSLILLIKCSVDVFVPGILSTIVNYFYLSLFYVDGYLRITDRGSRNKPKGTLFN